CSLPATPGWAKILKERACLVWQEDLPPRAFLPALPRFGRSITGPLIELRNYFINTSGRAVHWILPYREQNWNFFAPKTSLMIYLISGRAAFCWEMLTASFRKGATISTVSRT